MQQHITRTKTGKSFRYFFDGKQIADAKEIERIKKLAIPPAWRNVHIARSRKAKVQAVGKDKAGRTQIIYHPAFRARQEKAKFERIISFGENLPVLRRQVEKDLRRKRLSKDKVLACIVKLIDQAYFRIGNDIYAHDNHTYGITTLRSKHTNIKGSEITFDFTGKSHQPHTKKIKDPHMARILKQLDELPGYEMFKYYDQSGQLHTVKSSDVNAYIKRYMGSYYSAKDFRTWGGTLLATAELALENRSENTRERKKTITACIKKVAKELGNTPTVTRDSYVDPRVINAYITGDLVDKMKQTMASMRTRKYLSRDELCVLRLLKKVEA